MEIIDEVRQTISKSLKIPVEKLTPDARLDEIGAESLDVIEIIFELEEKFGINIPFEANRASKPGAGDQGPAADVPFSTVGDVAKLVKQLVDAKAAT